MAKPIKHTPVVKGQDALRFLANITQNKHKVVEMDIIVRIRQEAQRLKAILKY